MRSLVRCVRLCKCTVPLFLLVLCLPGCGRGKSDKDAVDQFFKDNPTAKRSTVARFAGTVTVDGQPPEKGGDYKLFILLNDPNHLEKLPTRHAEVADNGSFTFTTYLSGDGVPVGKYIVEFVQLHLPRQRQRQGQGVARTYVGPDRLKNLYNDPEKNRDNPEFVVEVTQPGRTDYQFNLSVAGRDTESNPGKYAATVVPGL